MTVREAQSKRMHDMVSHVWCQHLQNFQTHSVPCGTNNDLSKHTGFCLGRVWWDPSTSRACPLVHPTWSPTNSARDQFVKKKTNFGNKVHLSAHHLVTIHDSFGQLRALATVGAPRDRIFGKRAEGMFCKWTGSLLKSFADNARQQLVTRRSMVEDVLESGTPPGRPSFVAEGPRTDG